MIVSIVIPTLHEYENLKQLLPQIAKVLESHPQIRKAFEIIIADDDADTHTEELMKTFNPACNIQYLPSKGRRGLARAVLDGFESAQGSILLVMDGDGSHQANDIPFLLKPILEGDAVFTIGSRYIEKGTVKNWPLQRHVFSKFCALITQPITGLKDSMSGFFAFKRNAIDITSIKPNSWKISLELCRLYRGVATEVPITFTDRAHGKSKLSLEVLCSCFIHVIRLYYTAGRNWFK